MQDVNYLSELFTSTSMWSLMGPAILVTITYFLTKEDQGLGLIWYLVSCIMAFSFYIDLSLSNAFFVWHILIIVFGGFMSFILEAIK